MDGADKEESDEEEDHGDVEEEAPVAQVPVIESRGEKKDAPTETKPAELGFHKRRPKSRPFVREVGGHGGDDEEADDHKAEDDGQNPIVEAG